MMQEIEAKNDVDADGNPAGGYAKATGFSINWQSGPLGRGANRQEPNGAFVEGVIEAARQRIDFYQKANGGKFACLENALAITKLEEAIHWLRTRTQAREARAVEGTHTP